MSVVRAMLICTDRPTVLNFLLKIQCVLKHNPQHRNRFTLYSRGSQ